MKAAPLIVLLFASIAFADADTPSKPADTPSKPKDLIVGKWEMTEKIPELKVEVKMTLEFTRDGTLTLSTNLDGKSLTIEGKYKFIDDRTFETEGSINGKVEKDTVKIDSITKNKMVLSNPKDNKKLELTRVK